MRYIISDIHGQDKLLEQLLSVLEINSDSRLLFLGDLNDSRNKSYPGSFLNVYKTVRSLTDLNLAVCLQSNHQHNLQLYLERGKSRAGLLGTVAELEQQQPQHLQQQILHWLEHRPHTYKFVRNGRLYKCAHAYYSPDNMHLAIRGPVNKQTNQRIKWWLASNDSSSGSCLVAGHYHEMYLSKHALVLDPYGDNNDGIACFDLDTSTLITVTHESGISKINITLK